MLAASGSAAQLRTDLAARTLTLEPHRRRVAGSLVGAKALC
ncbi:hypothetical protein ACQEVC_01595 [Plantactinospora sp. CA-294935]